MSSIQSTCLNPSPNYTDLGRFSSKLCRQCSSNQLLGSSILGLTRPSLRSRTGFPVSSHQIRSGFSSNVGLDYLQPHGSFSGRHLLGYGSSRPRTCVPSSLHNEGETAGHGCFEGIQSGKYVLGGIQKDLERRFPHYLSDFRDGFHPKAASSVLFLYFACLAPCIAFGGLISHVTDGNIGVVETLVGTSGAGIFYALTAGQPLTLLGPTGLMVVFCGLLYKATLRLGLPFLPVYGWVGLWSGAFLILLAIVEASDLIRHFTRFTDETFSALISLGYISEAIKNTVSMFKQAALSSMGASFLALLLASGTWKLATFLTQLKNSRFLRRSFRNTLSDFGPPLAIVIISSAYHQLFPFIPLPEMSIPSTFSTTSGRLWQVPLFSIPTWVIVASIIPAALFTLLVFLDQGTSIARISPLGWSTIRNII